MCPVYEDRIKLRSTCQQNCNTCNMGKRMEGDDVEIAYNKNSKKTRCIWISLILLALVLFAIGIIIGFFVGKAKSDDKHEERKPTQTEAQREEQRKRLRDSVNIENLRENLRLVVRMSFICVAHRALKLD